MAELPSDKAIRSFKEILGWEMNPGDTVILNMLTLHASKGLPSNQRRRVRSLRFMGMILSLLPAHGNLPLISQVLTKG